MKSSTTARIAVGGQCKARRQLSMELGDYLYYTATLYIRDEFCRYECTKLVDFVRIYDAEVRLRTKIPLSIGSTLQHEVACEYEYEFGFEKRLPPRPENHHFLDCISSSWITRLVHWLSFDVLSAPGKLEMLFSPSPPSRAGLYHLTIFSPTLRQGNFHVQCKGFSEQTRLEPRYESQRLTFRFVGTVFEQT